MGNAFASGFGHAGNPRQMHEHRSDAAVRLDASVASIEDDTVVLKDGEALNSSAIVVATDAPEPDRLGCGVRIKTGKSRVCVYDAAFESPPEEPLHVLNGVGGR